MRIRIYQSFYEPEQYFHLDRNFIPINNLENKDAVLREYPILCRLHQKNENFDGYWGLVSWRFKEKCNISGKEFADWIQDNPGYDVYHFNHSWNAAETTSNMFVHGERYHKGMIEYTDRLLEKLGYRFSIRDVEYPLNLFMTCHFHVGNRKYWDHWMSFLETCIAISKTDEWMSEYLYTKESDHRKEKVANFCFVVERLVSLFLFLNQQQFKVLHYPYSKMVKDEKAMTNITQKGLLLTKNTI